MWSRIILDDLQSIATAAMFAITAAAFVITTIRAIRMDKVKRKHMADLPLQKD